MEIRIFAHSWLSDWNHGNAHFLRGLARSLIRRGHQLRLYEPLTTPLGGWSLGNLIRHEPELAVASLHQFRHAYPELDIRFFVPLPPAGTPDSFAETSHARALLGSIPVVNEGPEPSRSSARALRTASAGQPSMGVASAPVGLAEDDASPSLADFLADGLDAEVRSADLVIVHEWAEPGLIDALLQLRRRHRFLLLLHDTHHRAVSETRQWARLPLRQFDGILVFGESLRRFYQRAFGLNRLYVLHEAADVEQFHPLPVKSARWDLVWIGNWGDEERTREIEEYLLRPAERLRPRPVAVHGVRYPRPALDRLRDSGIAYGGYLPNLQAPALYSAARLTVHIPRSLYRTQLPGIPTIRVFEALACGCPLLTAPWDDQEGLFTPGRDFLMAANGREMTALMLELLDSDTWRQELARQGRRTILDRHTCDHRARELEEICRTLA